MYGLMLLLLREIFDWLWLIGVSPYAALVIRGGGAPVRFLTSSILFAFSFLYEQKIPGLLLYLVTIIYEENMVFSFE